LNNIINSQPLYKEKSPWRRPENIEVDRKSRDSLVARGYWQAFQIVKTAVQKVITGNNPGTLARTAHKDMPSRWEAVCGAMPALFDLLERETDPGSEPCSAIGSSAISIPIPMETGGWRAS
jgi:hypothetical protein